MEVDTPVLSCAALPDPFIESFRTQYIPLTQIMQTENYYLHTSPEFPMKRLLASGCGSIFQISKVFRQGESGHRHNPEFTLLEWYRVGWDHHQLMNEVRRLLTDILSPYVDLAEPHYETYQSVFQDTFGIDPHSVSKEDLIVCAEKAGLGNVLDREDEQDRFLELLFSHKIEPALGISKGDKREERPCLCFLYHYPASQASLAKIALENGHPVAQRFEVFINGMELGNGFHELNDAEEQMARFTADNQYRKASGQVEIPVDERFIASLDKLPECAGVALGIERLLMIMSQTDHINDVIAFPFDRA